MGLLLAFNHTHPTIDDVYLIIAGACVLVALKLFQLKTANAFNAPQDLVWNFLTSFSVQPAQQSCRVTLDKNGVDKERKISQNGLKEKKHVKDD